MGYDSFYPSVDIDFITEQVTNSGLLEPDGVVNVGNTVSYVVAGTQAVFKRTTLIRQIEPGQVCFEQATAIAIKFRFIGDLLEWLETNRSWKEGAYIESKDGATDKLPS